MTLIGQYQGSGFKEAPYLLGRDDGQVVQVSRLLYLLAEALDGRGDLDQVAARVSDQFGRRVSPSNVAFLIENKLSPLGILSAPGDSGNGPVAAATPAPPLLALKFRGALLPEGLVRAASTHLRPLFLPSIVVAVLATTAVLDVWIFALHGVSEGIEQILLQPLLLVALFAMMLVSSMVHEFGHATACHYGGAKPGRIGIGIYLVWLVFYNDVTDTYRLDKRARLRTDLGGIYFNLLFILIVAGAYFLTGFEPLLVLILVEHFEILRQFMPFLRLDGYYVVSDLTGVPDLFSWIKPILRSAVPGRGIDRRVLGLKRWTRVVVTAWVFLTIPFLVAGLAMLVVQAPEYLATGWDSLGLQWDAGRGAWREGDVGVAVLAVVQIIILAIPLVGTVLMFGLIGVRAQQAIKSRSARTAVPQPGGETGAHAREGKDVGLTPEDLEAKTFHLRRQGYDRCEVEAFLVMAADHYREALAETKDAQHRSAEDEDGPTDPDVRIGREVVQVLKAARQEASRIRQRAEEEAATLRQEVDRERRQLDERLAAGEDLIRILRAELRSGARMSEDESGQELGRQLR